MEDVVDDVVRFVVVVVVVAARYVVMQSAQSIASLFLLLQFGLLMLSLLLWSWCCCGWGGCRQEVFDLRLSTSTPGSCWDVAAVGEDAAMQWWPGRRRCPATAVDAETVAASTTGACLAEDASIERDVDAKPKVVAPDGNPGGGA